MKIAPLTRAEVQAVVEGRGCAPRVPVLLHQWTYPGAFGDRAAQVQAILDQYPQDA